MASSRKTLKILSGSNRIKARVFLSPNRAQQKESIALRGRKNDGVANLSKNFAPTWVKISRQHG
jgi:hypothetical protein